MMDQEQSDGLRAISEMSMGYVPNRILTAALQLDVFSRLTEADRGVEEVAALVEASIRGTRMLLDSLVALELLVKRGNQYGLTPASRRFLVRESLDYMGGMIENDHLWRAWNHLTEAIRSGGPVEVIEQQKDAEDFFPALVRSIHVTQREAARRAAEILAADSPAEGLCVLDVACGSGVWGISLAEAETSASVTFHDFPGILDLTREYARRHGVEDRCDYLAGDLKHVDFGENRFDVAILGNIVHSEGEDSTRDLFARLFRALNSGGRLAIIDMIPNDERTGPPFAVTFAVTMLLHTRLGDTYTLSEYDAWLKAAGFRDVQTAEIDSHSPLIVGVKP